MNKDAKKSAIARADSGARLLHDLRNELNNRIDLLKRNITVKTVHDLRVAVRRLQALLRAFDNEINPTSSASVRFDLKCLLHAAGAARDAHVRRQLTLSILRSLEHVSSQQRKRHASILNDDSKQATLALHTAACGADWASCVARINESLAAPQLFSVGEHIPLHALVSFFAKRLRRIDGALDHKFKSDRKLHRLRLKIKTARYLGELLYPPSTHRHPTVVTLLRRMQGDLGDLHDVARLHDWLRDSNLPKGALPQLSQKLQTLEAKHRHRYLAGRKPLQRAIKRYLRGDADIHRSATVGSPSSNATLTHALQPAVMH